MPLRAVFKNTIRNSGLSGLGLNLIRKMDPLVKPEDDGT